MHLLLAWLFAAVGFVVAERLLGPSFKVSGGFGSTLIVAALFGVLNALVGWAVFLAIGVLTLGIGFLLAFLTRLVANAVVLKLTDVLSERLKITGFFPAVAGAAIISVVAALGDFLVRHH